MNKNFKIVLPIIVMILAVGIAYLFYATKTKAKRKPEIKKSVLVEVMHAKMMSKKIWVHANGIVKPTRELSIFPLVSGQIIDQSKRLVPGGFFKKGDMIVRIDPQDYLFIREQRKAEVETASFDFKLEQGRGKIAEREWDLLKDDVPEADSIEISHQLFYPSGSCIEKVTPGKNKGCFKCC